MFQLLKLMAGKKKDVNAAFYVLTSTEKNILKQSMRFFLIPVRLCYPGVSRANAD